MQVKRIAGALGAELSGIDLRQPLDKDAAAQVRQALLGSPGHLPAQAAARPRAVPRVRAGHGRAACSTPRWMTITGIGGW